MKNAPKHKLTVKQKKSSLSLRNFALAINLLLGLTAFHSGLASPSSKPTEIDSIKSSFNLLREKYLQDGYLWIPGNEMLDYLKIFGANADDLDELARTGDLLPQDPTLAFRKSKNGRFELRPDQGIINRLVFQPFVLDANQGFKRHDSGKMRYFRGLQDDVQKNSIFKALLAFKMSLVSNANSKKRPALDYNTPKWLSTVFHLRTITTPEISGEPALEGVHSDGVDHTMTTFLASKNLKKGSAETHIHAWDQTTGIPHHETDPGLILDRVCHQSPLDTLIFFDNNFKHSLSHVIAEDGSKIATRDMLIFFTRKPATEGHISYKFDSFAPHTDMPLQIKTSDMR